MFRASVRKALGTEAGAFDLPSIITGVVVVGVLAAGVLATVFGVIPFTQDSGAKQDLSSIASAQGVSMAKDGTFADKSHLKLSGYLSSLPDTAVIDSDGKSYCASVTSGTGSRFRVTAETREAQPGSCTKATTWTKTVLPSGNWMSSAVSQDGRTMIAVGEYAAKMSSDGGTTWSNAPIGTSIRWRSASMSDDGKTIAVAGEASFIWISKDGGKTWASKASNSYWWSVAVSRDGSAVAAAGRPGPMTSIDGGASWVAVPVSADTTWIDTWHTAWASANGSRLMMASSDGVLAVSSDRGATWTKLKASFGYASSSMGASDDGKTIVIGLSDGRGLQVSSDAGKTWTAHPAWSTLNLWVSADGKRIVRGDGVDNRPEYSLDGGNTWTEDSGIDGGNWRLSANADGGTLVAVGYGGTVWTGRFGYLP